MPTHRASAHSAIGAVALAVVAAGCAAAQPVPRWTTSPVTPAPPTLVPSQPVPSPTPEPATSSPSAEAASPAPSTPSSPSPVAWITDQEFLALTGGTGKQAPNEDGWLFDPPPPVSREQAEKVVRARFPGDRPLVWSGLVAFGDPTEYGWMIILGTAPGQRCELHAGLLDRALEGGIVNATTGDLGWTYVCG